MKKLTYLTSLAAAMSLFASNASAVNIGGVDFPQGAISFADKVVSYRPALVAGGSTPSGTYADPQEALGEPDYVDPNGSVSLGKGGELILEFVDNFLTGSGNTDLDLWIFEIGSAAEDTFVEISKNGVDWEEVGKVSGGTRGIDIDFYGFGTADLFSFVKLIDDPLENVHSGIFAGADIDAVGAITTIKNDNPSGVPDSTSSIIALGFGMMAVMAIRRRK